MKTKYDTELLSIMNLFEKVTRAQLKDCFTNRERLVFIIQPDQLRKALGKQNENVKKLETALNRKIKIVEFSPNILTFIKNLMYPLRMVNIQQDGDTIIIKGPDSKTKGLMIGARAQNLRNYEEITQKYFEIKEIKVI